VIGQGTNVAAVAAGDELHDERRPRRVYGVGEEPDPRFSLANERTLLAWLRTALAFVVTGIGAVALDDLIGQPVLVAVVAAAASVVGAGTAVVAYHRWQHTERALRLRRPLPSTRPAAVLVLAVVILALTGVVALVGSL
jgi:putative membrane protein